MATYVFQTEQEVVRTLAELVEKSAKESIQANGVFRIGVSGGSLVSYLADEYHGLPTISTDWSKWQLFFCDERYVAADSPDSTFGAYKNELIPKVPLEESQFVQINSYLPLADCATDYQKKIVEIFQCEYPSFDVLLLGMGPDGHTCSLFPGHRLLSETKALIAAISDAPKPPSKRITMTLPLINNARQCIFAIPGQSKAEMIERILVKKELLPAGMVKPTFGNLVWITNSN